MNRRQATHTVVSPLGDGFTVFAFSAVQGAVIGALAVQVDGDDVPEDTVLDSLAAGVDIATGAYTRLLADLLGEGVAHGDVSEKGR